MNVRCTHAVHDAYASPHAPPARLSRRSLLRLGRAEAPAPARWEHPCHAPLLAQLDPVGELAAAEPGSRWTWAPRGLPGALVGSDLVAGGQVRTLAVTLRFADADACYMAMVAPDDRNAAVRDRFDQLLAAQNNRPPAVEIDARWLLVTDA